MAGICYANGREKGLWFEIESVEKVVALKKARGADTSFEESLLSAWKPLLKQQK